MSKFSIKEIEEVIANGRRLIAEAEETLARNDELLSEQSAALGAGSSGPHKQLGADAAQIIKEQVDAAMRRIEQDVERERLHSAKSRSTGQRVRVRTNLI